MSEMEPWTRQLLSVIVSQLCKTIGWHSISTTCLQVLVDVLHRYLKKLGTNIHDYTEHYNHTFPALEEIHLAFLEMGVNIEDLKEYVDYVTPITIKTKVPKYPLEKKSNMNFLKPGSREVVTRPVHIHEHLPAMHPELSEDNYSSQETATEESALSGLPEIGSTSTFKKTGDNVDLINNKRITRLIAEETGRPVRELSCVMMTTSGFLSPAREGKLPEARLPKFYNQTNNSSNQPSSYPTVPPEVKGDHKKTNHVKSSGSSKPAERKIREEHQNGREDSDDSKIKKLASMKELSKLKAFKPIGKSADSVDSAKVIRQEKLKLEPASPKEPKLPKPVKVEKQIEKIPEPPATSEKLTTESNNKKLKIFKRISKVKEERAESPGPKSSDRSSPKSGVEKNSSINDSIEAVVKRSREKDELIKNREKEKVPEPQPVLEEPAMPESKPLPVVKHIKRKKKQKHDSEPVSKKVKLTVDVTANEVEKPKPMEPEPPPYSFFKELQSTPGLMPPALKTNLLVPRFPNPFMNITKLDPNCPHPEMPNLPLPPPMLMQPSVDVRQKSPIKSIEVEKKVDNNVAGITDKKLKKKMKKDKRERDKKKRDKKEKLKNKDKLLKNKDKLLKNKEKPLKIKDKLQKKNDKVLKKTKVKNKDKPKKKEKLNLQKEEVAEDPSVPKLKLKLGGSNSPQLSPSGIQSPKIVIKPIVKHDDTPSFSEISPVKVEREPSPELAKISALSSKPTKQKNQKAPVEPAVIISKPIVEPTTITISTKGKRGSASLEIKPKNKEKQKSKKVEEAKQKPAPYYYDAEGNQVWVCPTCGAQDDGSPMIGCDGCDAWYHWVCVGIKSPPESAKWFCGSCAV